MSEVELRSKGERVLRPSRPVRVAVEHGALEVERVADVAGQVPIQAERPGFGLPAGAHRGQTERDGVLIDIERVVAGRYLQRAPVPVAEVEVGARPHAGARVGGVLT